MIKLTAIFIIQFLLFTNCSSHFRCKLKNQDWSSEKEFYDNGVLKILTQTKTTHSCPDLEIKIVVVTKYNQKGEKTSFTKKKIFSGWGEREKIIKEKVY
jgi:hypothetical protein